METRSVAHNVLVAIGLVVVALFLWKILPVLMLAFAGIVLAAAIHAGSAPLARRMRVPEAIAVAIVVLAAAALLGAVGWLFGTRISSQAEALSEALPQAAAAAQRFLQRSEIGRHVVAELRDAAGDKTLAHVASGTLTAFGGLLDVLLVIVLSLYLAANPGAYRRGALRLLPAASRERVGRALDDAAAKLRRWLLGQLASMALVGVATGVGLALAGVPMPFVLGLLSGLLDFVPVIGPLAAAVPGVLVAFGQGPDIALWAIAVYVLVQFSEGHFIVPLVQRWAVSLPPAVGLVGVVVFGLLFGLTGVLFAMPLLVVAVSLVEDLYVPRMDREQSGRGDAPRPGAVSGARR